MPRWLQVPLLILACACLPANAVAAELCTGLPVGYRAADAAAFSESDLTAEAAKRAIDALEAEKGQDAEANGQHDHVVEGNLRLVEGYLLKSRAEADGTAGSVARFCRWLTRYGQWPE